MPSFAGAGTEADPYLISNDDDWLLFCENVARGTSYSGQYLQLNADLTISRSIGLRDDNPFSGTFLGNGHTLTANLSMTQKGTGPKQQGVAPFHYIKDATIKNLTVTGTITSATSHTSGLVGFAAGTNLIEGCTVNPHLRISEDYAGGIIGHGQSSATTIRNCVFSGAFSGIIIETGYIVRNHIGGIWGWSDSGTPKLENCLEKGSYSNIQSMHPIGLQGGSGTITDCYYVTPQIGSPQNACTVSGARQVYTSLRENEIQEQITVNSTQVFSQPCTISGTAQTYRLTEGISITPTVTTSANTALILGGDYTATLNGEPVTAYPITVTERGEYTLILTGKGSYVGTKTIAFRVLGGFEGEGTAESPYLINSADNWNDFVYYVSEGESFSGQYVRLAADISVSTMAGTSESNSFQGTFLGDGEHTLTFTKGSSSEAFGEENCAPFRYVKDATIRDLKVAGDIYTSRKFAAGLVAVDYGTTTITGCVVSTVIHSSVSGDGTHGGIVAMPASNSTTNIAGCVYNGRLLTTGGTQYCGGFVGWSGNTTVTVDHSLYAPDANITAAQGETAINSGATFVRGNNPTIGDYCYYTETMGDAQGTQAYAYATIPADLGDPLQDYGMVKAFADGILCDGRYYGPLVSITLADNADNSTTISEADGYVANVTLTGRTLYKDGKWNTLCLPFDVDNFTGTPLEGATVKTLASTSFSNGALTMNFSDNLTSITAGTPYIVKWPTSTDIENPIFNGVTINDVTANVETDYVDFVGTYSPVSIYTAEKTNLYLGADNTLYYPTDADFQVNACRGYFHLKQGLTAGDPADQSAAVRAFVLNFGEDEATGILSVSQESGNNGVADGWYTLDGRKLDGKPTAKGLYIHGGRKVVVK